MDVLGHFGVEEKSLETCTSKTPKNKREKKKGDIIGDMETTILEWTLNYCKNNNGDAIEGKVEGPER